MIYLLNKLLNIKVNLSMKKITLLSLLMISAFSVNAQEPVKVADEKKEVKSN